MGTSVTIGKNQKFCFLYLPGVLWFTLRTAMNPDHPILAEIRQGFRLRPAKHKMVDKSGLQVASDEIDPSISVVKAELIPAPPPAQPPPPPPLSNKVNKPITNPALLKLGGPSTSVSRDELLKSIRDGRSLRKIQINDRSSPSFRDYDSDHSRSITPQPPMCAPQTLAPPSVSPVPLPPAQPYSPQQYSPMSEDDLPPPPPALPASFNASRYSPLPVPFYEDGATMRFSPEPPLPMSNAPPAHPLPPQMNLRVMAPVYAQPVAPQNTPKEATKPELAQQSPQPGKKSDFVFNEEDLKTSQDEVKALIPTGSASQRIAMFGGSNGSLVAPKESNSGRSTPKMAVRKEFVPADKPVSVPTAAPIVRPPLPTTQPPPLPVTVAPQPPVNSFNGAYKFQRDENANKVNAGSVIKQFEEQPKEVSAAPPVPKFAPSKAHGAHFAQIRDSFTNSSQIAPAAPVSTGERVWKAAAMASATKSSNGNMNGSASSAAPQAKAPFAAKKNVSIPINAPWYVKKSDVGNIGSRSVAIPIRIAEENKIAKANGTHNESPPPSRISAAPQMIAANDRLQRIAQLHPEALHNGYKFDINLNANDTIAIVER